LGPFNLLDHFLIPVLARVLRPRYC